MKKKFVKLFIALCLSLSILSGFILSKFINDDTVTIIGDPDKSDSENLQEWLLDEDNQALAKSYYMMTDWEDTELEALLSSYSNAVITSNAEFKKDKKSTTKELAITYIKNFLSTVNKTNDDGIITYPLISLNDIVSSSANATSITPVYPYEDYTEILFTITAFMFNNYDKNLSRENGGYGMSDMLNYKNFGIRNISFYQREYFDEDYIDELDTWLKDYAGDKEYQMDIMDSEMRLSFNVRMGLLAEQFWYLENIYWKYHTESDGIPESIYTNNDALQVVCEGLLLGAGYVADNIYYSEDSAKEYYEEHKETIDEYRVNQGELKNIESLGQYVKENYFPAEISNHDVTPFLYQNND